MEAKEMKAKNLYAILENYRAWRPSFYLPSPPPSECIYPCEKFESEELAENITRYGISEEEQKFTDITNLCDRLCNGARKNAPREGEIKVPAELIEHIRSLREEEKKRNEEEKKRNEEMNEAIRLKKVGPVAVHISTSGHNKWAWIIRNINEEKDPREKPSFDSANKFENGEYVVVTRSKFPFSRYGIIKNPSTNDPNAYDIWFDLEGLIKRNVPAQEIGKL